MPASTALIDVRNTAHAQSTPVLTVVVPRYNERPNVAPLVAKLTRHCSRIAWEAVFVDDNSPDGTTAEVRRIASGPDPRCGAFAALAVTWPVLGGDRGRAVVVRTASRRGHRRRWRNDDETWLPEMLAGFVERQLRPCWASAAGMWMAAMMPVLPIDGRSRLWSNGGIRLAQLFLPIRLSDPMSGFFMLPRPMFEQLASTLTGQGSSRSCST